ncbi:hypothetical protein [Kriegella aquimaris]|uniref:Lipoprotein n=1 Tax=Kriegella aquimaris TaxID=192904 RepID=A0A1G9WXP7_9FLAO|nr:hypothetical protein [Kriegella aquimaris]SDM89237.1 hypothetical protein SAMN04488514_116103 [Kriegella aquimaris]
MKTHCFFIQFVLAISLFATGCSNDDSPDPQSGCDRNRSWGEQTKEESEAVATAARTFANSPSKSTCENFRGAYVDYLEALEKVNTCILKENEAEFLKAIENGKAELQKLNCNQDFQS